MTTQCMDTAATTQRRAGSQTKTYVLPRADVFESEQAVTVLTDLPGVRLDDVEIRLEGDTLSIEGRGNVSPAPDGFELVHREHSAAAYRRVFHLGTDIDRDAIAATMRDGVLSVTLPKAAAARAHKISVSAA